MESSDERNLARLCGGQSALVSTVTDNGLAVMSGRIARGVLERSRDAHAGAPPVSHPSIGQRVIPLVSLLQRYAGESFMRDPGRTWPRLLLLAAGALWG